MAIDQVCSATDHCHNNHFVTPQPTIAMVDNRKNFEIPEEFQEFQDVFNPSATSTLPPRRPNRYSAGYNRALTLIPFFSWSLL